MPLVTVIVPCYRQARWLESAVRSVLSQSWSEVEVVVVDDGSPDDPWAAIEWLADDPRVRFVRQENGGVARARNRGISEARGEYLAFLDSDDWLERTFIARALPFFLNDESLGFVYTDIYQVFERQPKSPMESGYSVRSCRRVRDGDVLPSLLLGGYFPPCCAMVRRCAVDEVGWFDVDLGGHADWDLWLRLAASGWRAAFIPEKLAYYRLHGAGMSQSRMDMEATQLQTLVKLMHRYPTRVAESVHTLIESFLEVQRINQMLVEEFSAGDARLREERAKYNQLAEHSAKVFEEHQAWIKTLEDGLNWHLNQSRYWEDECRRLSLFKKEEAEPGT